MRHFPWRLDVDQPWSRIMDPSCLLVSAQQMFPDRRKKMDSQIQKDCDFLINDARAVVRYAESVHQICAVPSYFCTKTKLIGTVRVGSHCWKWLDWNLSLSSILVWRRVPISWAAWSLPLWHFKQCKAFITFLFPSWSIFPPFRPFSPLLRINPRTSFVLGKHSTTKPFVHNDVYQLIKCKTQDILSPPNFSLRMYSWKAEL